MVLAVAVPVFLSFGRTLLSIFTRDPEAIAAGYIRLVIVMLSHTFSLLNEFLSGYLRGFGISVVSAALTMRGVCGIRIAWIKLVFPQFQTFRSIMLVYPISLCTTALLLFAALAYYRPAKKLARIEK